jgi:CRP-like cAMP-binding protein
MTSAWPNLEMESFASPRDHDAGLSFTSICDLPIFSGATEETRAWLEYGDEFRLQAGNALIREGDMPEYFFIVLEGRLRLTKNYESQQIVLATYTPGMTLGEKEIVMDRRCRADPELRLPFERRALERAMGETHRNGEKGGSGKRLAA